MAVKPTVTKANQKTKVIVSKNIMLVPFAQTIIGLAKPFVDENRMPY
jgi:hypothetical protein